MARPTIKVPKSGRIRIGFKEVKLAGNLMVAFNPFTT
jgi:hypothetical protein